MLLRRLGAGPGLPPYSHTSLGPCCCADLAPALCSAACGCCLPVLSRLQAPWTSRSPRHTCAAAACLPDFAPTHRGREALPPSIASIYFNSAYAYFYFTCDSAYFPSHCHQHLVPLRCLCWSVAPRQLLTRIKARGLLLFSLSRASEVLCLAESLQFRIYASPGPYQSESLPF